MNRGLILRPATIQDADILLGWRNDPETRKASKESTRVVKEEHIAWLSKTLDNTNRRLLISEKNGEPIGSVRADFSDGLWELSWTTAPNHRGQGLAKQMVALLASTIEEPIRAEIKAGNIASTRIAEYAGMTFSKEVKGVLYYHREAFK
jgi:RimJ/RimL family protein N-acetyltransferase